MPEAVASEGADTAALERLVHENAGGPVQGVEYRHVARWELETIATEIDTPDLVPEALALYDEIIQDSMIKFRELATVASAALYIAARQTQAPITQRTIANAGHTTSHQLGRLVTDLQRELNLVVLPPPPTAYLDHIQHELNLPPDARTKAAELVRGTLEATPTIQSGRSPAIIAAASMYHICTHDQYRRTQQAVAAAADVNTNALRDIYQHQTTIDHLPHTTH
ncbi:hypothetical protein [Halorubellus sp. PRR65]|uniref:hypothetical protein n=1 Tax=Halorubellus sp. PRR65 TaxID=3098148 RepID=UPI002B25A84B|nr:hypothetical protein [Halorubellus sp. PRR65]